MTANNPAMGMRYYMLALLAFVVASFSVQVTSHFAINAAHSATVEFLRPEPVMELGFLTMVLQGGVLAYLYPFVGLSGSPIFRGLKYGLLMGLFWAVTSL